MKFWTKSERRPQMNNQQSISVFNYLTQVQSLFSQYIQIKTQLNLLEKNTDALYKAFDMIPTQQNLFAIQNTWNQRYQLMQQIPQLVNSIVTNLTEATKLALSSIQANITSGNKLNLVLNDNAIASINSTIEQNSILPFIKELYRQYCITQNIPMQMSNIEMLLRMSQNNLPNFSRLKAIMNGY